MLVGDPVDRAEQPRCSTAAMPLVHERINKLTEAADMLGFLFVDEADFATRDVAKLLDEAGRAVVAGGVRRPRRRCRTGRPPPSSRRCGRR